MQYVDILYWLYRIAEKVDMELIDGVAIGSSTAKVKSIKLFLHILYTVNF